MFILGGLLILAISNMVREKNVNHALFKVWILENYILKIVLTRELLMLVDLFFPHKYRSTNEIGITKLGNICYKSHWDIYKWCYKNYNEHFDYIQNLIKNELQLRVKAHMKQSNMNNSFITKGSSWIFIFKWRAPVRNVWLSKE